MGSRLDVLVSTSAVRGHVYLAQRIRKFAVFVGTEFLAAKPEVTSIVQANHIQPKLTKSFFLCLLV